jgi:acyl-coenzyme A synthetase/AMP-(fatty) acid ligase
VSVCECIDIAVHPAVFLSVCVCVSWFTSQTAMKRERPYCVPEIVDSEDPLFILYTSGSTGQPKGVMHTTAGYLLYAQMTHRYVFDYQVGSQRSENMPPRSVELPFC